MYYTVLLSIALTVLCSPTFAARRPYDNDGFYIKVVNVLEAPGIDKSSLCLYGSFPFLLDTVERLPYNIGNPYGHSNSSLLTIRGTFIPSEMSFVQVTSGDKTQLFDDYPSCSPDTCLTGTKS